MTRDDFEKITNTDEMKSGKVRIELRYLGFTVVAKRFDGAMAEHCISYLEADEAKYPVELFEIAIKLAKMKLEQS